MSLGLGGAVWISQGACLITASLKSESLSQLWSEVAVITEELLERCNVASLGMGVGKQAKECR